MPVPYPREAIPEAHRCPACDGSGDDVREVAPSLWEPVDLCGSCFGTGLAPGFPRPDLMDEGNGAREGSPMMDERVGLARVYVLHRGERVPLTTFAPLADDDA